MELHDVFKLISVGMQIKAIENKYLTVAVEDFIIGRSSVEEVKLEGSFKTIKVKGVHNSIFAMEILWDFIKIGTPDAPFYYKNIAPLKFLSKYFTSSFGIDLIPPSSIKKILSLDINGDISSTLHKDSGKVFIALESINKTIKITMDTKYNILEVV